eukprot:gene7606-5466_t
MTVVEVFCGAESCYDVLKVEKDCTAKDIKKAYRKIVKTHRPDEIKESDAIRLLRKLTKAHDVLMNEDSRKLFNQYLNHEVSYFHVSGEHYAKNLPKSDVRLKYQRVVKYLRTATLQNLDARSGGNPQTQELHKRAVAQYDEQIKELRAGGDKQAGRVTKREEDPLFVKIVDQLVSEVKIEGGYRKPEWQDLFAVRLVLFPYHLVLWGVKYHRRYISTAPLSLEDRTEMARDRIGLVEWEEMLSEEERQALIEREIWKRDVYDQWKQEKEAEAAAAAETLAAAEQLLQGKGGKKISKKKLRRQLQKQIDEDAQDYDD